MQVVPPTLLNFTRSLLRERFSSFVSKPVCTFCFERATAVTQPLLDKLLAAQRRGAVVCSTPTALKSFALKFIQLMHALDYMSRPAGLEDNSLIAQAKRKFQRGERETALQNAAAMCTEVQLCVSIGLVLQEGVLMLDEASH